MNDNSDGGALYEEAMESDAYHRGRKVGRLAALREVLAAIQKDEDKHPYTEWDDGWNAAIHAETRTVERIIKREETGE